MKRTVNFISVAVMAIMLSSAGAFGQETSTKTADEKKKQEELRKQAELQKQAEYQKQQALTEELKRKQADIEAKRKEIQEKMKEIDAKSVEKNKELEFYYQQYADMSRHAGNLYPDMPLDVVTEIYNLDEAIDVSNLGRNVYVMAGHPFGNKPGSSWNYSRQVMEASFTNEMTMSADDAKNVNLSVSGDCAEGSMVVTIIMPDGKQLSEVVLDENGSLNWRKNFEAGEGNGWKNGKWTFRIKAKEATGNLRISMNSY
ncbi:MAG TPA: cell envelope integrity protein TolA [Bacteroidales bacterium]|nr:cell envelope integrity protein TolA [Bacteroidales bacterium]